MRIQRILLSGALLLFPALVSAQAVTSDSGAVRKQMQSTAEQYEATIRKQAPYRLMQNAFCDETVGRYCVVYDHGLDGPQANEPQPVKAARAKAIEAFKRGVEIWPTDSTL